MLTGSVLCIHGEPGDRYHLAFAAGVIEYLHRTSYMQTVRQELRASGVPSALRFLARPGP